MAKILILVGLLISSAVSAESLALYGGGYSHHWIVDNVTNESHDMLAIQYGTYVAGRFNNSYGDESYFIAYEFNWRPFEFDPYIQTFTWSGAVRGYRNCVFDKMTGDAELCLFIVGGIRYTRWFIEPALAQVGDATSLIIGARF